LKKRTKKLLFLEYAASSKALQKSKFFASFFKKEVLSFSLLPGLLKGPVSHVDDVG